MRSLYIYYKVAPDQTHPLSQAVLSMQAHLRALMPGLGAHLWLRDDSDQAPEPTWMEVYQFNGHADERAWAALDDALAAHLGDLPAGIVGERHREHFSLMPALPTGHGG
jgi:Domain of unknown function (DUF4936)